MEEKKKKKRSAGRYSQSASHNARDGNSQTATSGHNVQKWETDAEKKFLQENGFVQEEDGRAESYGNSSLSEDDYHRRDTYHRSEQKGRAGKRRIQREFHARKSRSSAAGSHMGQEDATFGDAFISEDIGDDYFDKKVTKAASRSEKAGKRLQKARQKLPKEKEYYWQRTYEEETGKLRYVLISEEKERPYVSEPVGKRMIHRLEREGMNKLHQKIAENEKENAAVEGAHKTEQAAEDVYHYVKYHSKTKAQKQREKIDKLEKKKTKADVELAYQKYLHENPQLKENTRHRQMQKRMQKNRIKREYVKARRAGAEGKAAKEAFTRSANTVTGIAKKLEEIAVRNKTLILGGGIFALLLLMVISGLSSCGAMLSGMVSTTLASTYLSVPAEIDKADLSFTQKEMELQNTIDSMENDHPGYDEYDYNLGAIGHDPYTLVSYLSAVHTEFTAADVEHEIQELFNAMYSLTTKEVEETRTRIVTKTGTRTVTDADGNPVLDADGNVQTEEYEYEEEEEYTVTILRITLTVTPLESIVVGRMDTEQAEIFATYTETKGGLQVFGTPVDYYWYYYISSYYGYRKNPNTGVEELHRGVDIAVPTGTAVYAAHDGTVTEAAYDSYYGNYVVIMDSKGYTTKYAHMDSLQVSSGQTVEKGTVIGKSGNTGSSTGSHLHIECLYNGEYYNPLFYFEAGTQTIYGETTGGTGGGTGNVIPPDSYDDADIQALMAEANKYLGMQYTFGGTPLSSFDCSAFVCWVFSNSGVHDLPRTTAQGIYDQCTPVSAEDAKAGDIVFFTGTYNAGRPVTHVGIYCGNGIMVHFGDPIQYTSIHTAYWQSHFYGFGRLS